MNSLPIPPSSPSRSQRARHLLAALAAIAGQVAPAAESPVYRCGSSYSNRPCGTAPPLEVADPRSEAERAQGEQVAARERRLAETLAAQRREREAAAPPSPTAVGPRVSCPRPSARVAARCKEETARLGEGRASQASAPQQARGQRFRSHRKR